jgi:hypothetical protein
MANLVGEITAMEDQLTQRIVATFNSVEIISNYVNVHREERFPDSDEDDTLISTIPDPNNPNNEDIRLTSILQLGLPSVGEAEYTGDTSTQLTLIYPITFDFSVVDRWDVSDPLNPWRFKNSAQFVKAVYLKARQAFKIINDGVAQRSNRTLGFDNVLHDYLQLDSAVTVLEEETKAYIHALDMSLTAHVLGVTV